MIKGIAATRARIENGAVLRPSRLRVAGLAAALLVFALAILLAGRAAGMVVQAIGAVTALAALTLLAGMALGRLPAGHIAFQDDGLEVGYRGFSALLPWHSIADVRVGEFGNKPLVALHLHDWQAATVVPPEARMRFAKAVGDSRGTFHAEVVVMTLHYGVDAEVLAAALRARLPQKLQ